MGCGTCVPKCGLSCASWANLSSRLRTPLPRYDTASPICFEDFLGTPVVATNRTDPSCVTPPQARSLESACHSVREERWCSFSGRHTCATHRLSGGRRTGCGSPRGCRSLGGSRVR